MFNYMKLVHDDKFPVRTIRIKRFIFSWSMSEVCDFEYTILYTGWPNGMRFVKIGYFAFSWVLMDPE